MIRDYLKAGSSATSLSVPVTSTVTLSITKAIHFSDKRVYHLQTQFLENSKTDYL